MLPLVLPLARIINDTVELRTVSANGSGRTARAQGLEDAALEGLRRCFVGSIGPTTTEALEEFGVTPAFEPSHPNMGLLVLEAAQRVAGLADGVPSGPGSE